MSCQIILFSPTGGTEKAARLLAEPFGPCTGILDLCSRSPDYAGFSASPDSVTILALPSYGGRVPALAAQRLKALHVSGVPCVLLCVYGNRAYEDTLVEMEDLARGCGFQVIAAVAAVAEHSILHQYATGRPDAADAQNLKSFGEKIARHLAENKTQKPAIPGNRPYKNAGGGFVPKGDKKCVSCGLCANECPAGAIDAGNPKDTDKTKCIGCMRCTVRCPQQARSLPAPMLAAASLALKKACSVRKECELFL